MRILYASMMLPYPPTFGKRMEIWACLRALAAEGHEITLVSFSDSGQPDVDEGALSAVCQAAKLVPLRLSGRSPLEEYRRRLCALPAADPYDAWRFRSRAFRKCVEELLASERFDAIVCGEVFMMKNIPGTCRVPIVLKKDHIAATILKRYIAFEPNPVKKAYGFIEYAKTRRWEKVACNRASAIMACSELEADVLRKLCPRIPVTIAPNVIDPAAYSIEPEAEDGLTILYHGLMDWFPNQDAVAYFIRDILPLLRRLVPNVRLVVAGRSSSNEFQRRFANTRGVEFVGTVSDMRCYVKRCAVCVVPLRIASGTRFKILEAAAMGKPVVSTRVGAEGLDLHDGSEIILADGPLIFAEAVAALLKDAPRRHAIGLAARRQVENLYSFRVLRHAIRDTLALAQNIVPLRSRLAPQEL